MRYRLLTVAGEQQIESSLGAQAVRKQGRPEGVRLALVLEGGTWTARSDGGRGRVVRLDDEGECSCRRRTGRSCVPLGKSLNPSLPQFPYLQNGNSNSTHCFIELFFGLGNLTHPKCLEQGL